jgi:hypothetical protein
MVPHGSQVRQYGSHIAFGLHTAPHGSQLNHMAPICCIWLLYNAVHLLYNNKQLPYGADSFHLTPHTPYMAHKVYRVSILPPYGFHMTQRGPHAPLGCHVHRMGATQILLEWYGSQMATNGRQMFHIGNACVIWGPYGAVCTIFEPCAPYGSLIAL